MKNAMKDLVARIEEAEPDGGLAVELWDGEIMGRRDRPRVVMRLKSERALRKVLCEGFLGFGEVYMDGELEVDGALPELLRLGMAVRYDWVEPSFLRKMWLLPGYLKNRNSLRRASKNITHHYDLGEDFYSLYLDKSLTYSCAYFKSDSDSLEQAQVNKYEHIARKLMLKEGENLIDIGCGWGGMLIHAALNYGTNGVGITLSPHQYEYINCKVKKLGLQNRVRVILKDYRDMQGKFDKFVSIGMFEHVGRRFIPAFMCSISQLLKKGGLGLLHTIGKDVYSSADYWTMRYIFPGAYLPSLPEIADHMGENGLSIQDVENLRLHYARTLDLWAENFERSAEKVKAMFGETFVRMWRLYLNASSAAFKYGETRLYQILFTNGLNNNLPLTRDHVYSR